MSYFHVRTVIGEPDPDLRAKARHALEGLGFAEICDAPSLAKAHQILRREGADLLFLNMSAEESDAISLVEQIRSGRLTKDPFPIVIALIEEAAAALVKRIACSGVDDALIKPFSDEALIAKIEGLSNGRKPFIVTFDYIGPERRAAPRQGMTSARQIDVPNPLAMRDGEEGRDGYAASRDHARGQLEQERILRLGAQMEWLAAKLSDPSLTETDKLTRLLDIEWAGKELIGRIGASSQEQLLRQLISQSQKLRKSEQVVPVAVLEKFHEAMKLMVRTLPSAGGLSVPFLARPD